MEESISLVKICSRKRKKNGPLSPNSNPLMGILTRSKSRMYLHPNQSGLVSPDPILSKSILDCASLEPFLDINRNDASRVSSIKDLRMKRVFTPEVDSVPQEDKDPEEEKNEERRKLVTGSDANHVLVLDVDDVKVDGLENSVILKPEAEDGKHGMENSLNLKDRGISGNGCLSTSKMALNRCCRKKVFMTSSSLSYKRMLPYLLDIANVDSSDSRTEIVDGVNCEVRSTSENKYAPKNDSENQEPEKVPIRNCSENHTNGDDASVEEHIQTTPPDSGIFTKTEFGLLRESMEANKELAENQAVMGFLVDTSKSNSDVVKQSPNSKCKSVLNPCSRLRLFKNPRSISYKRLLPYLMDISKNNLCASKNTEVLTQDSTSSMFPLPPSDSSSLDTNDIRASSTPQSTSSNCSSNLNLQTEEIPHFQTSPAISGRGLERKDSTSPSEPSLMINSDVLTDQCTSKEPFSVGKQKVCLDMGLELHNNNLESIEKVNSKTNSFQVEASSDALVCPSNRLPKGILKRNRLGCRGLCNCLNCASFRLHADRAFDFSRNQMHDSEEVMLVLMKELADLRLLLEKSIPQNNDSSCVQLELVLVKQACNKALEAEKMAKGRLNELNDDLNVHCRIPALLQPKVTFAGTTQERATSFLDPLTITEKKG